MNNGKNHLKHYLKIFLFKGKSVKALTLLCVLHISSLPAQDRELSGFNVEELAEDEAGLWMIVEKQEQYIRTSSIYINDSALNSKINEILCRVVGDSCFYLRPYVIRSPGFNAFMMPNGAFFIQSGLLLRMKNDDQLASVIGHEASHYFRSHSISRMREIWSKNNAFAVVGALVSAASRVSINSATTMQQLSNSVNLSNTAVLMLQTAQIVASLQLLDYSRENETEADLDSVEWMSRTKYEPRESIGVWQQLITEQESAGKNAGFSLLNTHPAPERRIKDLSEKISALPNQEWKERDSSVLNLIAEYREDWLIDEMRILHPDQFKHVINKQIDLGFPEYLAKYFEALAYLDAAERKEFSNRKKSIFKSSALESMSLAAAFENSLNRPEIFRDLGKLREEISGIESAKESYEKYLKAAPDAWDARFIRRKL